MNLGFGAPLVLWGALLVAAPVLIHLLNRRRYDVRPFAAMAFLQQAWTRRRRRMRLESLLLLILRCAAVLLAALAMALPFVSSDSPLALLAGGSRDVVLIVDRSASTTRTLQGGSTLAERITESVRRRVARLSDERGDSVTLLTPGGAELLPLPIGASPSVALAAIDDGLPAPRGGADLVAAVRLLKDRVRPTHRGRLELEVFTDLQARSWGEDLGPLLQEVLDDGGGSLRIVDLAADLPEARNLGVEEVGVAEPVVVAGEPFTVTAVLANHSSVPRHGVTATVVVDDGTRQQRVHDLSVPPRGRAPLELRLRIDEPGSHHVTVSLAADELPFDDTRTLALHVRDAVDVLLVDGRHGLSTFDRATAWLELALDPHVEQDTGDDYRASPFRTRVVDASALADERPTLAQEDLIVLADVGELSRETAAALREAVAAGTPLLVFTGEPVLPALYEELLGDVLPAGIGSAQGDPTGSGEQDYVTLALSDPAPPELLLFADPRLAVLLEPPVLAWRTLVPKPGARVLASFVDALGTTTPAIVAGEHGRGAVLVVGTSADDSWSLLPTSPATWLPLVHELVGHLAADDRAATNVPVGQAPALVVEGRPDRGRLELAGGALTDVGRLQLQPLGELGQRSLLSLEGTPLTDAGPWTLELQYEDEARPASRLALAALPDAREGDLRRLDPDGLAARLAPVEFVLGEAGDDEGRRNAGGGDGSLFRALLWMLLACVAGEALLARAVGGRR